MILNDSFTFQVLNHKNAETFFGNAQTFQLNIKNWLYVIWVDKLDWKINDNEQSSSKGKCQNCIWIS